MIKLDLPPKPKRLSDALVQELTAKFKADGSDVWNADFIRKAVGDISFDKCCYSECKLGEEGKYMEVDHFYYKDKYKDKVVEWGNLLPSNKKCNTTKGNHDVGIEPILNPCIDDPKEHLYIKFFRYYPKTEIGKLTIEVVALNDRQHFANVRAKIGLAFIEKLNEIHEIITEESEVILTDNGKRRKLINRFKRLLQSATKENEYAANMSTVILTEDYFPIIEKFFKDNELWDNELTELVNELQFCCLIK